MTEFAKPEDHRQSAATSGTMTSASSEGSNHQVNGMSNGHGHSNASSESEKPHKASSGHKSSSSSSSGHKSSSKDKYRDKDRDHHRSSSSSHKSSSSSSHKSSHKDKSKDKERSGSSSHKSSSSSSADKHRDGKSSSSSGSGEHKKDRDKDKDRHKGSSSSGKSSSSSSSKDHKSSSGSSSSKDKSLSSSSHHHSSSSSKKRDKDKERSSRDKDRDKSRKERHGDGGGEERKSEKPSRDLLQLPPPSPVREDNDAETTNGHVGGVSTQDVLNGSAGALHDISQNRSSYDPEVYKAQVKVERMDVSQASSCDYSLSQFRDDEQPFVAKAEPQSDDGDEEEEEAPGEDNDDDDDEDIPLFKRKRVDVKPAKVKREAAEDEDDDEDVPLTARKKAKSDKKAKKEKKKNKREPVESDFDEEPKKKKVKKEKQAIQQIKVQTKAEPVSPTKAGGRKKKDEAEEEVWKWWEEEKRDDGVKWNTLEHKGPVFAPAYEPLPKSVRFEYDGRPVELSQDAEEIATFYARMLDHEYTSKKVFNDNFFKDWRKSMSSKERDLIKDLSKCNFRMMAAYFAEQSERNKNRSKEEKQKLKEQNEALLKEYGFCIIDGHREKIGNFKIEPPGLFRGRGEHPKMGHLKRRVVAEDIILNCSKGSVVPKPPPGHKWKEVRHDNTVTWLASWVENVQGQVKYIMLNPSSRLKGEKDWAKYETARRLDKTIDKIRATYRDEWKSKEMRIRQRAVALYFIDKLALRAGNEKDEDQADTVGCCSLRVEHIALHKALNGKENVVVFDFLGKDSIRYYNEVEVEKRVFKNLELFRDNKKPGDDLFDRLNTVVMNEHLRELMEGLTAKVFRTYNASITLQRQLDELTEPHATVAEKLLQYNRANRAVAILCNHQRAVPKTHSKSMENLKEKIRAKREQIKECEAELKALNKEAKRGSTKDRLLADKKQKALEKLQEQLQKLEIQETDRDENKTIALGTSKLNYLDPRISVAWCKKNNVPIEKIFNKTQRDKFRWAIDMAGPDYRF